MSLEVATWVSALATVVLAAFAVVTAWYARKAFRKQAEEVGLLIEQNSRDADERRRAQAARVFLGVPPEKSARVRLFARNASDLPVYDAEIWYLGSLNCDTLGDIMPGETRNAGRTFPPGRVLKYAYLMFRDAEGISWTRGPGGRFRQRRHALASDEMRDIESDPRGDAVVWEKGVPPLPRPVCPPGK